MSPLRSRLCVSLSYTCRMSLSQIQYFVAVAEEGTVGKAASRLAISQPPLTRQIRMLEDELGTPLFTRGPKGMSLLPAGERFLVHAVRILAEVNAARRTVFCSEVRRPQAHLSS